MKNPAQHHLFSHLFHIGTAGLLAVSFTVASPITPLSLPAQAQQTTANSYIAYYNQAMTAFRAGNSEKAIELLTKAHKLNPNDTTVINNLAASYIQLGVRHHNNEKNYALAADNYRKALFYLKYMWPEQPSQPANNQTNIKVATQNLEYAIQGIKGSNFNDAQWHMQQGWNERRSGNMQAAMVSFGLATDKNPKLTDAWTAQGDILTIFQRPDRAAFFYEKAVQNSNNTDDTTWVKLGNAYLKGNNSPKAAEAYNQAVAANPKNKDALLALEQIWKKEIVLNPRNLSAHLNLGTVYQRLERFNDAQAQYNISSQLSPNNPVIDLNLGSLAQAKGELNQALSFYDKVLAKDPNNSQALINKADILKSLNRPKEAEIALNRALSGAKDKRIIIEQLLANYELQGDAQKIKGGWENYSRTYPEDATVQYRAGLAMHEIRDYDKAVYYYRNAVRIDPKLSEAYANLGSALHAMKRDKEALEVLQKAQELNPNIEEVNQLLLALKSQQTTQILVNAASAHDKGDYRAAIEGYEKTLATDPNNADVLARYGLALQAVHRDKEALEAFNKALGKEPNNANFYYYKGLLLEQQRDTQGATVAFKKALSINPDFEDVKNSLANMQEGQQQTLLVQAFDAYERTNYTRALQLLEQVLKYDPQNAQAFYYQGLVYEGQNKLSLAKRAYESSIQYDNTNADAVYALAVVYDTLKEDKNAVKTYQQFITLQAGKPEDEYITYAKERLNTLNGGTTPDAGSSYGESNGGAGENKGDKPYSFLD